MKIIHLINTIKPGGAESVMVNYIKVCNSLNIPSLIIGSPVSVSYEKELKKISCVSYTLDYEILEDNDIIFVHSNINLVKLLKYYKILKRKKIRIYYIQHLNFSKNKFMILSKLINILCEGFIQITPITKDLVKKFIKTKIYEINNFYINKYNKEDWPEIRREVREELHINGKKKIVMFSAIFKPGKGLNDYLKLCKESCKDDNYIFLLVGDGPESYLVKENQMPNLVWIGRQNDVERYLIASNIYVFLSKFKLEMMPMALLEAINTDKDIMAYDTILNNYLLDNKTLKQISYESLKNEKYVNGEKLKHFDFEYGVETLKELIITGKS